MRLGSSTGPNRSQAAWTLSEYAAHCAGGALSRFIAAMEARCPPAERPMMPMRSGSMWYFSAWARRKRMAVFTSTIWSGQWPWALLR